LQIVSVKEVAERFSIQVLRGCDHVGAHHVFNCFIAGCYEQIPESNDPQESFIRIGHIGIVGGLRPIPRIPAKKANSLVNTHIRSQTGVARVYQAFSLFLDVIQEPFDFPASLIID
jgi:hypothetical protein